MSSPSFSLTPPSGDISVQLLSQLLGPNWWQFASGGAAPSGAGSILSQLFSTFDVGLLAYVSALLVWQATVGAMATANEGIPLGKRYHSVWAPIRGPSAFAMLFPLPGAKGLAMIQVILLVAVHWGIGVADSIWSVFVNQLPANGGIIMPYNNSAQKVNAFAMKMVAVATAQNYLINRDAAYAGYAPSWNWVGGPTSGTWVYSLSPSSTSATASAPSSASGTSTTSGLVQLGAVEIKCSADMNATALPSGGWFGQATQAVGSAVSDVSTYAQLTWNTVTGNTAGATAALAQNNSICQSEKTDVTNLYAQAYTNIAKPIVMENTQSAGVAPSFSAMGSIVGTYLADQTSLYDTLSGNSNTALQTQVSNFASESSSLGWASSSFYYWTLENINQQAQAQFKTLQPTVILPSVKSLSRSTGAYILPYLDGVKGYLKAYQESGSYVAAASSASTVNGATTGSGMQNTFLGGEILNLAQSLTSGQPLPNLMSFGGYMIDAGEGIMMGVSVARDVNIGGFKAGNLAENAAGGLGKVTSKVMDGISKIAGTTIGGTALNMVSSFMSLAPSLADLLAVFLIIEGAGLAYFLPMLPSMIMIAAVVGWLFLVVELMVAAPLWAAAHAYAEGEGFAPQQANYGYSAVVGILARPVLLTFGFIFMFFIINLAATFTGDALQIAFVAMNQYTIGPVAFVSYIAVTFFTLLMVLRMVLKLITHLADRAPQWLGGHSGQGLGEENIATQANESAKVKSGSAMQGALAIGKDQRTAGFTKTPSSAGTPDSGDGGGGNGPAGGDGGKGTTALSAGEAEGKKEAPEVIVDVV